MIATVGIFLDDDYPGMWVVAVAKRSIRVVAVCVTQESAQAAAKLWRE